MEIIHNGNKKKFWIGDCSICKSLVRVLEHELKNITPGDYRSDNEDFAWELCPVCGGNQQTMLFHREGTESANRALSKKR